MSELNTPTFAISVLNATGLILTAGYFFRQNQSLQEQLDKTNEDLKLNRFII